jgi:hypothetical protein
LRKSISLTLYENTKDKFAKRGESKVDVESSKGQILLEITSIKDNKLVFSKPYGEVCGKTLI